MNFPLMVIFYVVLGVILNPNYLSFLKVFIVFSHYNNGN
ncbi:hypothetical protein PUND_a0704 [Pseudoalteromonas undina]|nr:hypothetical protein PUND_a0704 [Pseudoalteromonas undina]